MKATWLNDNESTELILFFNGWGQDERVVDHLATTKRVLMLNDYRTLDAEMPDISGYTKTYVVGWSMGVWAAANTLSRLGIEPTESVALCGSERPVDDAYGIPTKILKVTLRGLRAKGCGGFAGRMFASETDRDIYPTPLTLKTDAEQIEELEQIEAQSQTEQQTMQWTRSAIAQADQIFPTANLAAYWTGRTEVNELQTGHCPFHLFGTWENLIELCPTNNR